MAIELAEAYISLIPSLRGAQKEITSQLKGVDLTSAGNTIGKSLSSGMAKSVSTDTSKLKSAVEAAEKSVASAMNKSADATKQVEIAQKRLNEARSKYGDDSSKAAQAELNLSKAQRDAESAASNLQSAQSQLAKAKENEAKASGTAANAEKNHASALSTLGSAVDSAKSKLAGMKTSLNSAGKEVANLGSKLTTGITVPFAAAGVAAGTYALNVASSAETAEMSFTTMLGSAEAAKQMLADLSDFAAHTPFELSGLLTATQKLMAYGFTADEVIPMLTAVGDATAALGTGQVGIDRVTIALGQMKTRGKVAADEMRQLTEAGIPAWEYLARAIGTDTAGAMEAVSKGAITADQGIQALTQGMEQDFGGMIENQSKTVAGLMSNLSDAIQQPLMQLKDTAAYDHFADALSHVVDAVQPFVESILPYLEDGLDAVASVLDVAASAMENFANADQSTKDSLVQLLETVVLLGPAMKIVGTAVTALTSGFNGWSLVIGAIAAVLAHFVVESANSAAEIEKNTEASKTLADIQQEVKGKLDGTSEGLASVAKSAKESRDQMLEFNRSIEDTLTDTYTSEKQLDEYVGVINELADQSNLSASDQERLKAAVKGYNDVTGESIEVTDAVNGKLSEGTDVINKNADAWKRNAEMQAYQNIYEGAIEQQARAQMDLVDQTKKVAEAQQEVNEKKEQLQNLSANDPDYAAKQIEYSAALEDANKKLDEANDARNQSIKNMQNAGETADQAMAHISTLSNEAVIPLKQALDDMGPAAQNAANTMGVSLDQLAVNFADAGISAEQLNAIGSSNLAALAQACDGDMNTMIWAIQNYNGTPLMDKDGNVTCNDTELIDANGEVLIWNGQELRKKNGGAEVYYDTVMDATGAVYVWNGLTFEKLDTTAQVEGNATDGTAEQGIQDVDTAIENTEGKTVDVNADGNYTDAAGQIQNLADKINSLRDRTVTVTTNYVENHTSTGGGGGGNTSAGNGAAPASNSALTPRRMAPALASVAPIADAPSVGADDGASNAIATPTLFAAPAANAALAPISDVIGTAASGGTANTKSIDKTAKSLSNMADAMAEVNKNDVSSTVNLMSTAADTATKSTNNLSTATVTYNVDTQQMEYVSSNITKSLEKGTTPAVQNLGAELGKASQDSEQFDEDVQKLTESITGDTGLKYAFETAQIDIDNFSRRVTTFGSNLSDVTSKVNDFASSVADGFNRLSIFNSDVTLNQYKNTLADNVNTAKYWQKLVDTTFSKVADYEPANAFRQEVLEGGIEKYGRILNELAYKSREEIIQVIDLYNSAMAQGLETGAEVVNQLVPDPQLFNAAGEDIANGIAEGITDGEGAVKDSTVQLCSVIEGTVKDYFGIHSPSRLMRALFQNVGKGAGLGIADEEPYVTGQMSDLMDSTKSAVVNMRWEDRTPKSNNSGAMTQTINFNQPVKTPAAMARELRKYKTYGLAGARR